ncbi:hypothetical protein BGZ47_003351, partial [Haplosporangium gracile]
AQHQHSSQPEPTTTTSSTESKPTAPPLPPYIIFDVDETTLVEVDAIRKPFESPDPVYPENLKCDTAEFTFVSAKWNCTGLE